MRRHVRVPSVAAQRRPEHKLRRHAPADAEHALPSPARRAQRRPEHKLRRHAKDLPDTRPRRHAPAPLNEGRSISSGDTLLRALHRSEPGTALATSLNEGRSISSGDTPWRPPAARSNTASTFAQRRPEHKLRRHIAVTCRARAGRMTPAQRRPEHKLRRHADSPRRA